MDILAVRRLKSTILPFAELRSYAALSYAYILPIGRINSTPKYMYTTSNSIIYHRATIKQAKKHVFYVRLGYAVCHTD